MNTQLKNLMLGTVLVGLVLPTMALAQRSGGGVAGGARLRPGTWNSQSSSRSVMRSQPVYRSSTGQSESVPTEVAQKGTDQRSFSYEPKEEAKTGTGGCGCDGHAQAQPSTNEKEQKADSGRSFSYEPSTTLNQPAAPPSQSTQRVQSPQRSYGR